MFPLHSTLRYSHIPKHRYHSPAATFARPALRRKFLHAGIRNAPSWNFELAAPAHAAAASTANRARVTSSDQLGRRRHSQACDGSPCPQAKLAAIVRPSSIDGTLRYDWCTSAF
jgi:hypothetical protein